MKAGAGGTAAGGAGTCCSCSRAVLAALGVALLLGLLGLALGLALGLPRSQEAQGLGAGAVAGARRAIGGVAADHTACSLVGR